MSENYKKLSRPPLTAIREIKAGDLKGKSDINPQWRYEIMDEIYGACGSGWKFEVVKLWDYPTQDGTILCFAQIALFVCDKDGWSFPIPGIGGNTLVDMVKAYEEGAPKRPKPNDEGYKMAITDALGTAMKMLGVAADIYRGNFDGSKYRDEKPAKPVTIQTVNPETEKLAKDLIDWMAFDPPVFNAVQMQWAEKQIAEKNVEGMRLAIAKAVDLSKAIIGVRA